MATIDTVTYPTATTWEVDVTDLDPGQYVFDVYASDGQVAVVAVIVEHNAVGDASVIGVGSILVSGYRAAVGDVGVAGRGVVATTGTGTHPTLNEGESLVTAVGRIAVTGIKSIHDTLSLNARGVISTSGDGLHPAPDEGPALITAVGRIVVAGSKWAHGTFSLNARGVISVSAMEKVLALRAVIGVRTAGLSIQRRVPRISIGTQFPDVLIRD